MQGGFHKVGIPADNCSRRRYAMEDVDDVNAINGDVAKETGDSHSVHRDRLEAVTINIGVPSCKILRDVSSSISWRDRVIVELNRIKIDAYDGVVDGGAIGLGVAAGAVLAALLILGITPASAAEGGERIVIGLGVGTGASVGIGAGLGAGLRARVLAVAGVAAVAAGFFVAVGAGGATKIEGASEVATVAALAAGAATVAAVAGGIVMSVITGVFARRNWTHLGPTVQVV